MFQNIGHVYSVLSNPKLKEIYDKTGSVDSDDMNMSDKDWDQYFRDMFPKLTKEAIKEFEQKYKGFALLPFSPFLMTSSRGRLVTRVT